MGKKSKKKHITSQERGRELRRTHFTLGEGQAKINDSEYGKSFFRKRGTRSLKVMKEQYHKNSHFKLGTAPNTDAFGRMSDHYFVHHKNQNSIIIPTTNKGRSNFKLGNWVPRMRTTTNREFYTKSSNYFTPELQNAKRNQMRIHNYQFGVKGVMNFNTNYNRKYNEGEHGGKGGKSKQELLEDALRLRSSNIVLGTNFPNKISEFQGKFDDKNPRHEPAVANSTQGCSNIKIGRQGPDFKTTFQEYFPKKKGKQFGVNQKLKDNHFKTHFKVGTDRQYFKTLAQNSFKNPLKKKKKLVVRSLHASNFALGVGGDSYTTSYDKSFNPFSKNVKGKSKFGDGKQRKSNFGVGYMSNNYLTEFQKQYNQKKAVGASLDKNLLKDLRSSHFGFSDLAKPTFQPAAKSHYGRKKFPKMDFYNGYNVSQGIVRGQSTHFKVGNSNMNFDTSNTRIYTNKKGAQPAKLDPGTENMLKTHHFKVQDRETKNATGNPIYRTAFPWKIRVEDC